MPISELTGHPPGINLDLSKFRFDSVSYIWVSVRSVRKIKEAKRKNVTFCGMVAWLWFYETPKTSICQVK